MQESQPAEAYRVRVDSAGRVVVPSDVRQRLGIEPGCDLILTADEQSIHLQTFAQVVQAAQVALAPYRTPDDSVVDELIRERRAEAKRERNKTARPADA